MIIYAMEHSKNTAQKVKIGGDTARRMRYFSSRGDTSENTSQIKLKLLIFVGPISSCHKLNF